MKWHRNPMLVGHLISKGEITQGAKLSQPRAWPKVRPGLLWPQPRLAIRFRPAGLQRTASEGTQWACSLHSFTGPRRGAPAAVTCWTPDHSNHILNLKSLEDYEALPCFLPSHTSAKALRYLQMGHWSCPPLDEITHKTFAHQFIFFKGSQTSNHL